MSRFFKNMAKSVNKLYYGEISSSSMKQKVDNFADYLGDTKYKEKDSELESNVMKGISSLKEKFSGNKNSAENTEQAKETTQTQEYYQEQRQEPQRASVPFMITKQMKLDLIELGYSIEDIKRLTPIDAHRLLQEKIKK